MNEQRQNKKLKNKNKIKERRAEQKAEAQRIKNGHRLVKEANAVPDPLEKFPSFQKFERNGLKCGLMCRRVTELEPKVLEWAMDLCKRNMQLMYEKSGEGWKEHLKREEMCEDAAWYLIVTDRVQQRPVAFSHFRFDMDYGEEVLYCYELQLETEYRQQGLGRFMLQVLELMAFTAQMSKVVLTVFKHNTSAVTFFNKCKYTIDETSPENTIDETFDYHIMSKENKVKNLQRTSL
ncbi:hypothetical protein Pmani_030781 [Petrolisthes manimaculis]|uniref:N-alpha-acetyltransferase 40 n=1 Tax=Petrolisthes manimaculis TaxID=1843537 RepID=A0AAE1NUY5_9EUCA|nr:hypothetical protein Pmani_030781 [Petrolisthes manimaculis]